LRGRTEDSIDLGLTGGLGARQTVVRDRVMLEPIPKILVLERLDQIVHNSPVQGPADRVDLTGSGDHERVDVRAVLTQSSEYLDAVHVR